MRYPDEFSDTMLWKWKFGIALKDEFYRNRIIMPSFDASGNLNYYTSRAIDGRMFPKYLNPNVAREDVVFNELDIDWQKPLVIVEGPFDLVKCPKNSTCLLGSELTEEYRLFQKVVVHQTPVILSLDSDETGRRKTEIIANMLYEYGVTVRIVSYPKNIKDPGDLSIKEFIDLTNEAKLYSKVYSIKNKIANLL
jgi:DNA primase